MVRADVQIDETFVLLDQGVDRIQTEFIKIHVNERQGPQKVRVEVFYKFLCVLPRYTTVQQAESVEVLRETAFG
jgi:hypothetical protein